MRHEEVPGHPGVVTARVSEAAGPARALASVLDDEERARAARFRFPADADRHRVAHVLLRLVLGRHVGEPPGRLVLLGRPCAGCGGPRAFPASRPPGPWPLTAFPPLVLPGLPAFRPVTPHGLPAHGASGLPVRRPARLPAPRDSPSSPDRGAPFTRMGHRVPGTRGKGSCGGSRDGEGTIHGF